MVYAGGDTFWSCGYRYLSPNYMAVVSKSIDGGQSWSRHELYSGSSYGYVRAVAVDPSDSDKVFAIGYKNSSYAFFKTVDGGSSWSEIVPTGYTGTPYDMEVHPTDPDRIAVASSSGLYATSDGGLNWAKVTSSFSYASDLYQSAELNALIVSTTTGIWLWENWSGYPVHWGEDPGVAAINCVVTCAEDQTLYAGTAGGAVWASSFGVGTEYETHSSIPSGELIVWPNPVTGGSASLKFTIAASSNTSVVVHDITGRAVQILSSRFLSAGTHEFRFDVSELSSGIYFMCVQSGSTTRSARFVIYP